MIINKYILVLFINLLFLSLMAQKHDNIWLLGYDGGEASTMEDYFGITVFDFSEDTLSIIEDFEISINFSTNSGGICNKQGELLFYTNGVYIENTSMQLMENGDNLQEDEFEAGYLVPQGILVLPYPNKNNQYILFHTSQEYLQGLSIEVTELYYSIIDMQQNNGLGEVTLKKEPLILDTLQYGQLTTTKHANGRDWWVLVNEGYNNRFYTLLVEPEGVSIANNISIGLESQKGVGQAVFSPDGTQYATISGVSSTEGSFLAIYDFDRCSGELNDPLQYHFSDIEGPGGVAISPNSRYLYVSLSVYIYQYDLWAEDILASRTRVAVYDGFQSPFSTRFFLAQLAPDGKIYINSPNGVNVMHVIHNPNEAGAACNVEQHGIQLPTYNGFSMPNHPNYRLGALEGSPCDSLTNSTEVVEVSHQIKVYPNPSSDYVKVHLESLPRGGVFYLVDALGKPLIQQKITSLEEYITITDLPKGIYFYQIKEAGQVLKSGKLIVQN